VRSKKHLYTIKKHLEKDCFTREWPNYLALNLLDHSKRLIDLRCTKRGLYIISPTSFKLTLINLFVRRTTMQRLNLKIISGALVIWLFILISALFRIYLFIYNSICYLYVLCYFHFMSVFGFYLFICSKFCSFWVWIIIKLNFIFVLGVNMAFSFFWKTIFFKTLFLKLIKKVILCHF